MFSSLFYSCKDNKKIKIAIILKAKNNPFYNELIIGIQKKALGYGIITKTFYGKDEKDWVSQKEIMEKTKNEFDAYIVTPNNSEMLAPTLLNLKQLGKPTVVVSDSIDAEKINALSSIRVDSLLGGKMSASYVADMLYNKKVKQDCIIIMTGNLNSRDHIDRRTGILSVIKKQFPKIKIFEYEGFSSLSTAYSITNRNIEIFNQCSSFIASSDTMIIGIRNALVKNKKPIENKLFVGFDGIAEIQSMIMKENISATVKQETSKMGELAVASIFNYLNNTNEPLSKNQIIAPRLLVVSRKIDSLPIKHVR